MLSLRSLFLVLILTTACAASRNEPPEPWRVEVTTAGGLAGSGVGSFAIDSAGTISVKTMQGESCSYQASEEERRRFRELLAKARPQQWSPSYMPEERCCDRIEYTLTLDAGRVTTVQWIDQPAPMPADLAALADALLGGPASLRVVHGTRCAQERSK